MENKKTHLTLAKTHVTKNMLLTNLAAKGVHRVSETGISIEMEFDGKTFFIFQPPLKNECYTDSQLNSIENILLAHQIELHPIDYNLC